MAYAQSFGERLLLGVESTFGVTPGTPKAGKIPVMNPAIKLNVNRFRSEALSGSREPRAVTDGKMNVSGSYDLECSKDALMYPLWGLFGQVAEYGSTGHYDHIFTLSPVNVPPFFFEQGHADISQYVLWNGVKHSTGSFRIEMEGLMKATFNVVGAAQAIAATSAISAPNIRDDTGALPFDYTKAALKYAGATIAYIQSLGFDVDAGLEGVGAIDGTKFQQDVLGKVATLRGTIRALFKDASLINDSINSTEISLDIVISDTSTVGHGIRIFFPTALLQPSSPTGAGGGAVVPVEFNWDGYGRGTASDVAARAQSKGFTTITQASDAIAITIDGGSVQNKTLGTGALAPAATVTAIGAVTGATVFVENGRVVIQSSTKGSASSVNVSGAGATLLGFHSGAQVGLSGKSIVITLTNATATVVQP